MLNPHLDLYGNNIDPNDTLGMKLFKIRMTCGFFSLMKLFDGRLEARKLDTVIEGFVKNIPKASLPILGIVLLGDNASSQKYINLKMSTCSELGINVELLHINSKSLRNDSSTSVYEKVEKFCNRKDIASVIIQLPLPLDIDNDILDLIPIEKDVDLLTAESQKRFYEGDLQTLSPVVLAFKHYFDNYGLSSSVISVALVGYGALVGKPLGHYLEALGVSVNVYDIDSGVTSHFFEEDLVICATGVPNLLRGDQLKGGCSVVDFGSGVANGRVVGDFDLNSDTQHLAYVSPSPGGMGPLVIRYLLLNHLNNC